MKKRAAHCTITAVVIFKMYQAYVNHFGVCITYLSDPLTLTMPNYTKLKIVEIFSSLLAENVSLLQILEANNILGTIKHVVKA